LLDFFSRLFGKAPAQLRPTRPAQSGEPPEAMSQKVLVIVYNPQMSQSARLIQARGWNSVDSLIKGYIADLNECSGRLVNYNVVDRKEVDDFPTKQDGFRYTAKSYADATAGQARPHNPDTVDYNRIVADFNLMDRAASNEIDEVWMFGFPFAGFYESRMVGAGAFWCNAPPLEGTERCPRRFVIMGFSYERGVGEMLEDFGHRTESVMTRVYQGKPDGANLWKRFSLYDKIAPGRAEVGMMHFAPNSERDYDWGNRRVVSSSCDDWLSFPILSGQRRQVSCPDWGNGDIRLHHKWWFERLPKAGGETDGVANNWWKYAARVDDPYFDG
jgi:hypothetical protein